MKINSLQKNRAFTLVETLVSISIFTVSLLGIMSILASGISSTNYAKKKMTAVYLAQEGIEYIRNVRDTKLLYGNETAIAKWQQFQASTASCTSEGNPCKVGISSSGDISISRCGGSNGPCKLYINTAGGYDVEPGVDSGFSRKVWREVVPGPDERMKVFSQVEWTQGSGQKKILFSEDLYQWIAQ